MKKTHFLAPPFLALIFWPAVIYSDESEAVDEELVGDIATISPEEAVARLKNTPGTRDHNNLIRAAFESRRLELVRSLFVNTTGDPGFAHVFEEQPESLFKDSVFLMMLRTPAEYWRPDDDYPFSGSQLLRKYSRTKPFEAILHRYFPSEVFEDAAIETPEARLELASSLEKAMKEQLPSVGEPEPTSDPSRLSGSGTKPAAKHPPSMRTSGPPLEKIAWHDWPWWLAAAAAAVGLGFVVYNVLFGRE